MHSCTAHAFMYSERMASSAAASGECFPWQRELQGEWGGVAVMRAPSTQQAAEVMGGHLGAFSSASYSSSLELLVRICIACMHHTSALGSQSQGCKGVRSCPLPVALLKHVGGFSKAIDMGPFL